MIIVGIDEVGRGYWAGPLVAAAALINVPIFGLDDSKKLTKLKRENLSVEIYDSAEVGIGWVSAPDVDKFGLTKATEIAMALALEQIISKYDQVIIDGNLNYLPNEPLAITMVGADGKIPAVSAASIVAKVARDKYMAEQAKLYPGYGFDRHVGYGTAAHIAAIKELGVCELHRLSYKPIKSLMVSAKKVNQA